MKNLKHFLALVFFGLLGFTATADDSLHVRWSVQSRKTADGNYLFTAKGQITKGWHVYAKANEVEGLNAMSLVINDSTIVPIGAGGLVGGTISSIQDPNFESAKVSVVADTLVFEQAFRFGKDAIIPDSLQILLQFNVGNADNFLPEEQAVKVPLEGGIKVVNRILIPSIHKDQPVSKYGVEFQPAKSKGLLSIFLLGFLGGLVALLTPCVFPMIPLTVSFFTKKATSRKAGIANASIYGFFIFLIYVLLSLPFHFISSLNPEILNNLSTNVYLNVFFFLIFIFFAGSFFGWYELTLPASLSSKSDSKAGVGNLTGIFFMALTLALVSFSCTGPILGSLLAGSLTSDGGAMQLSFGMGGFGLALALPFALFALFPNWLQSLPKSGGWLNTVKVVLGFLEVGMAFKFLSNADLVMHWGILKREIFIAIWILTSLGLSLYLFNIIRFPHDSPVQKISKGRLGLALFFAAFTIYLVPGLTNTKYANLKLLSGFPPPLYYSLYQKGDCVLGLNCSKDYEEGIQLAKAQNKAVLLDFTGYACVNCRKMEENVWSEDEVYKVLKDSFIVISLYVDDKKPLPAALQFTHRTKEGNEKQIKTVGDKWATFETENFVNNAQPYYAILSPDEVLMNFPVGYTPDHEQYLAWLRNGLATMAAPH